MTDLKVSQLPLTNYLPTVKSSLHISDVSQRPKLLQYLSQAKIHHGFALAYQAVADLLLETASVLLRRFFSRMKKRFILTDNARRLMFTS